MSPSPAIAAAAPPLLCFGEILWDQLPHGSFPGGAPFNVAYHLRRQGAAVRVVSAVGRDALGDELLRRLAAWGLATDAVARHADLPTGTVTATLGPGGDAHYEIAAPVAWDRIVVADSLRLPPAAAVVFGSLALRSTANQHALEKLFSFLPSAAWRVFDVNLRPPFDDLEVVARFARGVTLLKLNAAEAARLAAAAPESAGREESDARALAARYGAGQVCVTAGARGAGLLIGDRWHWEPGRPVRVVDTVGAGDSFLATLLVGLLAGLAPDAALGRACRVGEWVATQPGATPDYTAATPV